VKGDPSQRNGTLGGEEKTEKTITLYINLQLAVTACERRRGPRGKSKAGKIDRQSNTYKVFGSGR